MTDPRTGTCCLAQVVLEEGETMAHNLEAKLKRLAHLLKDAIEWEYRQSVKHLRWERVRG